MSGFDIAHEIVVDSDVPDLAPVLLLPLPDLDPPDEPQEGGTVKFFQLCVLSNQLHPLLDIIGLLLVRLQFARQMRLLLQLLLALGLILVHQLDTDGLRDAPHHFVLIDGLHQLSQFSEPPFNGRQEEPGLLHLLGGGRPALGLYPLYQAVRVTLRKLRLCPDVSENDLDQHLLVYRVRCAGAFPAGAVPIAQVTLIGGLDRGAVLALVVVPMMAHDGATVHTDEDTRKQVYRPTLCRPVPPLALLDGSHQFPDLHRHQWLMRPLHPYPFGLRLANLLVNLVGHIAGLVLHRVAEVDLVAEYRFYCHVAPVRRLAPGVRASRLQIVIVAGRGDFVAVQYSGYFSVAEALAAKVEDALHDGGGGRVNYQDVLVLRAFQIAVGGVAADILSGLKRGAFDCPDFGAGVPGVQVVHDIFQNHQHLIVLVNGVHAIVESDKPAAHRREHDVRISASLDVISAETTEVFAQYQIDFPSFGVGDHLVEHRPVES